MGRPLRILYPGAVYHVVNPGLGRQVALWLGKTRCDLTHAETSRDFRLGSPGSVRWVYARIRERVRENLLGLGDVAACKA